MIQREKKKIDKKYRIERCAWLLSYVTIKQNISVQTVNFSSFPFKFWWRKKYFFYNKICGFLVFCFFTFFNITFFFSFLQKIIL